MCPFLKTTKLGKTYYNDLNTSKSNDLKHLLKVSKNLLKTTSTPVLPPHKDKRD